MKTNKGFTVIELLVVILFLITAGVVLFFQIQKINTENNNTYKKTSINAIYYSLEEGFYSTNNYYPEHIEEEILKTLDPDMLTDPYGVTIGEEGASYRYEAKGCNDGKCKSYTLRTSLDGEDDFVKESRNK